jgi:hypothetical protein
MSLARPGFLPEFGHRPFLSADDLLRAHHLLRC